MAATCVLIFLGSAQAQSVTIGETAVLSAADGQNGNLLLAQSASLTQAATIQSLSFYVTAAKGNLILGIYDATGPNGGPGALRASTLSLTPAKGWNTANVASPVSLAAGTYWLAYLPSSSSLTFRKANASGACAYFGYKFGALPSQFSTSPASCTPTTWSFYATLATSSTSSPAMNGACGSSNGASLSSAPTANLCTTGTASTVSGASPWSWSCAGSNGGSTATCSATKIASAQPVNGACGASNGASLSSAPTANLCAAGTASAVSGAGPWSWSCGGSDGGTAATCSATVQAASGGSGTGGGSGSAPTLIQHVASSANPVGLGIPGNNYKIPLPNPVLAGDALVLAVTYPHGNLATVSDSLRQTWPTASVVADGGSYNYTTAIYVRCGSAGGSETITVGLSGSVFPFEYTVSEFNNVAASNCVDGSVGGANLSPGSAGLINPGSFTPLTNNNANGGHIIWSYTALSSPAGGNPTSWSPASGFTLLDGDIAWINKQGFPHASQWSIQTQQAAVTPSIASTGDTADTFNSASVSLVAASAGGATPPGIHINKIIHETWISLSSGATLRLQLPTTGNLRVLTFPAGQNNIDITSITDSDNSAWTLEQTGGDSAQIWFAANRPANPNLIVSIHTSGTSPPNSTRFYDVQGAAASPFDVAAGTDLTPCSSETTIANQPTITPTGANELVIATMGIGDGPGLAVASGGPSGAVWDLTTYSAEVDMDLMENADALAHVYATTATTEHWNWTITSNGDNSCSAEAVAFKPAG
jgi:hypothetical protein